MSSDERKIEIENGSIKSAQDWQGSSQSDLESQVDKSDRDTNTVPEYSFFDPKLSAQRKRLKFEFSRVYIIMIIGIMGLFSIYWGSMYGRNDRIRNLRMLVVIEDDITIEGIPPILGDTLREVLETPTALTRGNWHIFNSSEFAKLAAENNNNIEQELERQIHHQNYWSSIYVKPNATWNFYNALIQGDGKYNVSNNSIISVYETGRDFVAMNQYVTPSIQMIERIWLGEQTNMTQPLLDLMSNASEVLSQPGTMQLLASPIQFIYFDRIKYTDPVLLAPSQVGLIYTIIVTFFQFNFLGEVHIAVAKSGVNKRHYVIYRFLASVASFFVLSFAASIVSLAFQVDFTKAFGHSGFLVYWAISFLTMWAVGSASELAALLCITVYPPLIGFWLMFWVIINVAPTFTPLALSAKFYRYGYAMPIYNSYEATKVVLFNTYKGALGRHIGILIAWIVLLTIALPFALAYFGKTMTKKAQLAAQKQAMEEQQKQLEE
ncbi:uncharacterized protein J8A68_002137 [[Candida] subhashii]|uniref:DUF3533 domain-containing protein n=1 Tax=[Candida] subhashii TaxID=561895 RepID=A0A8J5UYI2_9ASCO|nr:uncharacterized protein J8A68_002137 [[Candida] subhashii]KAG7664355.1 hypothetical protein J8A68_002137 [[Candida] subhashii]